MTVKQRLIYLAWLTGALLLTAYLGYTAWMAFAQPLSLECRGMSIKIRDNGMGTSGFVTQAEIARELEPLPERAPGMSMRDINTEAVRRRLEGIDKIEDVEVVKTTDGYVSVMVTPLVPVMRIYDGAGSYYVNRVGKRMQADARYHSDVPIVAGLFPSEDTTFTPLTLLPLLQYIDSDSRWRDLVTMVDVRGPDNIYLVPAIAGHIIQLGDVGDLESKFGRLERMYTRVLPVKGWQYYDTLSVKWAGQVVATRRNKPRQRAAVRPDDEEGDATLETMLAAEGVAPGQTRPGASANNERLIPAAQ